MKDLERCSLSQLDLLCQKVHENPCSTSIEADQARDLSNDKRSLFQRMQKDSTSFKQPGLNDKNIGESQIEALRRRMVDFLAATPDRWN
ncbi:MAG: hypothetical protein DMG30_02450 [Acidobacteria bacterium]|nr:MAG: hypothetical protein DMG30_02450 [Acidobacteriota bacterium]PYY03328.1 MAG: hypothetical protein DMG69_32710 [Acidobacteriota bacterium]